MFAIDWLAMLAFNVISSNSFTLFSNNFEEFLNRYIKEVRQPMTAEQSTREKTAKSWNNIEVLFRTNPY